MQPIFFEGRTELLFNVDHILEVLFFFAQLFSNLTMTHLKIPRNIILTNWSGVFYIIDKILEGPREKALL